MSRRPNLLVFIPHDLGDFLHCYGHASVRSPNLDALANRGVRLSNCFTACSECTPSRSGLWTGLHPHQNGLMGLANFGWNLRVPHLAQRLGDAGYQTHLFGLQHEVQGDPAQLGYEFIHSQDNRSVGPVCDSVIDFLAGRPEHRDEPWFACAGFFDVHRPWRAPSTFDPDAINVVMQALAEDGHTKVLASPKILVNDNATGTLASVAEAPFTSVNASDTVATTSFAGYASSASSTLKIIKPKSSP